MDVGKHCALQSCNALDFLPIQCSCLKTFCRFHISPDQHDYSRVKCAFTGCNKPSLGSATRDTYTDSPVGCPGCQLSFCVKHRHKQSHLCLGLNQERDGEKQEAARSILSRQLPLMDVSSSRTPVVTPRSGNPPKDPKKLAQVRKIHLMKMRHIAVPGDPKDKGSAVNERLHLNVRSEIDTQLPEERVLWFRKSVAAGRALDLISTQFNVSPSSVLSLCLQKESSTDDKERQVLQDHQLLSEQIEDGSTVVLGLARGVKQ